MDAEKELERARIAASLLENEIYKEAVQSVRSAIIDTWASSPVRDIDGQHELRLMLKCLNDVQSHVENVMNTGKMVKIQREEQKSIFDRMLKRG